MSFPKAKLHRFNDEISCTPSPGKYDPKFDMKVKGVVIEKSRRFVSPNNVHFSTESLDNQGPSCSAKPSFLPVFRTPQLKRKVITVHQQRSRSQSQSEKSIKTKCVKEEQIFDNFREENKRLESEIKTIKEEFTRETERMKEEFIQSTERIRENFISEETDLQNLLEEKVSNLQCQRGDLESLKEKLDELYEKIKTERDMYTKYIAELELKSEEISLLQENLQQTVSEKTYLQQKIVEKTVTTVGLENDFNKLHIEMNKIILNHEEELKSIAEAAELNFEILNNTVTNRVTNLIGDFDIVKMELQTATETRINETFNNFELELQKLENDVRNGFNSLKDLEKLVKKKIDEFTTNLKDADDKSKFLYQELCKVEAERDELMISDLEKKLTIVEIQDKYDESEYNLKIAKEKCKKYEVSVKRMQETIKVLSDRLYGSESEVERLNRVESDLRCQKCALEEKNECLMEENLNLRKSMENMEKDIFNDVIQVKNDLDERLELFKSDAQNEIYFLKEVINVRDQEIVHKAQCILDFSIKIDSLEDSRRQADSFIEMLETEKKDLEVQLFDMTEKHFKLENQLKEKDDKIEDLVKEIDINRSMMKRQSESIEYLENNINQNKVDSMAMSNMSMQIEQADEKIQCLEKQLDEKDKICMELENKYKAIIRAPEPTLLQTLQDRIAQLQEENSELLDSRDKAQAEVIEIDQKLCQLMGHQNIRQKIKHVEQLKQENRFLKEEIDRLTTNINREKKRNKENNLAESPNLPKKIVKPLASLSPNTNSHIVLKDRNQ